jgi:hypothetical protein
LRGRRTGKSFSKCFILHLTPPPLQSLTGPHSPPPTRLTVSVLLPTRSSLHAFDTFSLRPMQGDNISMEAEAEAACERLRRENPPYEQPYPHGGVLRVYPFALCGSSLGPDNGRSPDEGGLGFSLMTHLDLNLTSPGRLPRLAALAAAYDGPLSVALRLPSLPPYSNLTSIGSPALPLLESRRRAVSAAVRQALILHLGPGVLRATLTSASAAAAGGPASLARVDLHAIEYGGRPYNHNVGRDVSMRHARTPYLLHQELDFVPSPRAAHILWRRYRPLLCGAPRVLVIPNFDIYPKPLRGGRAGAFKSVTTAQVAAGTEAPGAGDPALVPPPPGWWPRALCDVCHAGKQTLALDYLSPSPRTTEFQFWLWNTVMPKHPKASGFWATNYTRWTAEPPTAPPYRLSNNSLEIGWGYEPLFAFHRDSLGLFPEWDLRFAGRGGNRISHVLEIKRREFEFHVATDVWLCHPVSASFFFILCI